MHKNSLVPIYRDIYSDPGFSKYYIYIPLDPESELETCDRYKEYRVRGLAGPHKIGRLEQITLRSSISFSHVGTVVIPFGTSWKLEQNVELTGLYFLVSELYEKD